MLENRKEIRLKGFYNEDHRIIFSLIYDLIKENRKKYTKEQLKKGVSNKFHTLELNIGYVETEKSIILHKYSYNKEVDNE